MKKEGMESELLNFGDRAGLTLERELIASSFIPEPSWFKQFWTYFKTLIKIKYVTKGNILIVLFATLYAFLFLIINFNGIKIGGNEKPTPEYYPIGEIEYTDVSVGPSCELADKIAEKYKNSTVRVYKFNTESEVYANLREKLNNNELYAYYGIVIGEHNETKTSVKVVSDFYIIHISNIIFNSIGKKLNLDLSSVYFPYPSYPLLSNLSSMSSSIIGLFFLATYFIIMGSLTAIYNLESNKVVHLLRMSHMRDSITFVAVIAFVLFESLIICVVGAILFCVRTAPGTNYLYPLFFFLGGLVNMVLFVLWMMQLVRGKGSFAVVSAAALFLLTAEMYTLMNVPNIDHDIIIGLSSFVPVLSSFAGFEHIFKMTSMYSRVDFKLFSYTHNKYNFGILTIVTLACTLVHTLIYSVIALFKERWFGRAPLKWSNICSCGKWKKLFDYSQLSAESTDIAINIAKVDKTFHGEKEVHALKEFDLQIKQGEIVILIGPNGCGKTTLISAITGTQTFDSGEIDIYDSSIEEDPNVVRNIGIVFQESVFIKELTARENLKFFGTIRGLTKSLENDIMYLADQIGLTHCLDTVADTMSGGEKRKLSILIALLQRPQILILDEPTAGVDISSCKQIWRVINSYKDTTSLISAHALEEAENGCTRIIVMQNGELKFGGTPAELREQTGCGYKLSVEKDDYNYEQLLEFVKQYQPDAKIMEDRNCISLPNDMKTADAIIAIGKEKQRFGFDSFSVHVENLEDNLIRFIADHEEAI